MTQTAPRQVISPRDEATDLAAGDGFDQTMQNLRIAGDRKANHQAHPGCVAFLRTALVEKRLAAHYASIVAPFDKLTHTSRIARCDGDIEHMKRGGVRCSQLTRMLSVCGIGHVDSLLLRR